MSVPRQWHIVAPNLEGHIVLLDVVCPRLLASTVTLGTDVFATVNPRSGRPRHCRRLRLVAPQSSCRCHRPFDRTFDRTFDRSFERTFDRTCGPASWCPSSMPLSWRGHRRAAERSPYHCRIDMCVDVCAAEDRMPLRQCFSSQRRQSLYH